MPSYDLRRMESRVIFRDDSLGLREDIVATRSGRLITRKVVEYRRSVAVVALTEESKAILVRHARYPIGRSLWELPGGVLEGAERIEECAQRELQEEAGYIARRYSTMLEFYPEPAFADHMITIVLAEGARPGPAVRADEVEIGEVGCFALQDTPRLMLGGLIGSSWTIIGMMLGFQQLNSGKTRIT